MRKTRPIVLGILLALLGASLTMAIPGCSMSFEFEMEGTIKSTTDGKPMANVHVTLDAPDADGWPESLKSDEDGKFRVKFRVKAEKLASELAVLPTWDLRLIRDGYHDESIDVSLRSRPERRKETPRTIVVAYMRPRR